MRTSTVSCDTSVLVPALHPGYSMHAACRRYLPKLNVLLAHTLLESFRVLTSPAESGPLPPNSVVQLLESLNLPVAQLPAEEHLPLLGLFAAHGRRGGSIYDAQIAATAKHHELTLITRDRRAAATYDLVGVDYELI